MSGGDEFFAQGDHLRDMFRRARLDVRFIRAQRGHVGVINVLEPSCDGCDGLAGFLCGGHNFVVHVRDIRNVRDFGVQAAQHACQKVKNHGHACIADMGVIINGGAAGIQADMARINRRKQLLFATQRVMKVEFAGGGVHMRSTSLYCLHLYATALYQKKNSYTISGAGRADLKTRTDAAQAGAGHGVTQAEAEKAVEALIRWAGDNPAREGLKDTPRRVAKAFREYFAGYGDEPAEILGKTFEEYGEYNDFVLVRDISFNSHCEHHMVPIIGKAHVAYWPDRKVVGISKLARIVDTYARRLTMQEKMTRQIAGAIESALAPRGVAVLVDAVHHCMTMRGVAKQGASTVTSSFSGIFEQDENVRARFLQFSTPAR